MYTLIALSAGFYKLINTKLNYIKTDYRGFIYKASLPFGIFTF